MKWTRVQSMTNDDFPAKIQDQLIDEDRAYRRRKQKLIKFEQSTIQKTMPFGTRLDMQIYSNPKQMISNNVSEFA